MTATVAMGRLQIALLELGHEPGRIDALWGPNTEAAALALLARREGRWGDAVEHMAEALADLGWLDASAPWPRAWTPAVDAALRRLIAADGLSRAAAVTEGDDLQPPARGGFLRHDREMLQGSARYLVDTVMLHTPATPTGWADDKTLEEMLAEIRRWHVEGRGWRAEGYHALCHGDRWVQGRAFDQIGAGAIGHNRGVIHICMVNERVVDRMGAASDFYSDATLATARGLVADICNRSQVRQIMGHNAVAPKLCPGFRVDAKDWAPAGWAA